MTMGSCVYHVAHQGMRQMFRQAGQNVELPNYTQALYDARELAMERMQAEAQAVQAEGIVGVRLTERSHGWGSHVIEFFAIGTAIVPTAEDHTIQTPQTVLDLSLRPGRSVGGFGRPIVLHLAEPERGRLPAEARAGHEG